MDHDREEGKKKKSLKKQQTSGSSHDKMACVQSYFLKQQEKSGIYIENHLNIMKSNQHELD